MVNMMIKKLPFKYRGNEATIGFLLSQSEGHSHALRLPFYMIYPYLDKLNKVEGRSFGVISPHMADRMLPINWPSALDHSPFATDGLIGFEKPGARLGREIVFSDCGKPRLVLPMGKYHGETGIALVALGLSSADFRKDGSDIVLGISDERLIPVKDFPAEDGWYRKHKKTTVPCGKPCASTERNALHLDRARGCYVGSLARHESNCGRDFPANNMPWDELGLVVTGAEDITGLMARGIAPQDLEALLEEARANLGDISRLVKPRMTAALKRLLRALETREDK